MRFLREHRGAALRTAVMAIGAGVVLALAGLGGGRWVGLAGFALAALIIGDDAVG